MKRRKERRRRCRSPDVVWAQRASWWEGLLGACVLGWSFSDYNMGGPLWAGYSKESGRHGMCGVMTGWTIQSSYQGAQSRGLNSDPYVVPYS